jgi:hypothetical protein
MKKYIEADNIGQLIDGNWAPYKVKQAIKKVQLAVSVDVLQELINLYNSGTNHEIIMENLEELIKQEPKLYGGLTVEDWRKLEKLPYVLVELHDTLGDETEYFLDDFMRKSGEIEDIKELLPDPENLIRAHVGTEQPVPDDVLVHRCHMDGSVDQDSIAKNIVWSGTFTGYRIVGIKDN